MKTVKVTFVFLALAVLVLFTSQSALGDSEVAKPDSILTINKSAPGSALNGSLTVYYEPTGSQTACAWPHNPEISRMFYFIKVKRGGLLYGFSGVATLVSPDNCYDTFPKQQEFLMQFFAEKVVPPFFGDGKAIALRSVTPFVTDDQLYLPDSPLFSMMDFELAVK